MRHKIKDSWAQGTWTLRSVLLPETQGTPGSAGMSPSLVLSIACCEYWMGILVITGSCCPTPFSGFPTKWVSKVTSLLHKWNLFGAFWSLGGFIYLGSTSGLLSVLSQKWCKNFRDTCKSKPLTLAPAETILFSKYSMMESPQITSYHCFTASCKEQHITHHTSGTAKPYPEHEAPTLLMVEQGKSHSHALPQSKIRDITTVVSKGL